MVRLLLDLGADPNASDAVGMTALAPASQAHADPAIVTILIAADAKLDFLSALYLDQPAAVLDGWGCSEPEVLLYPLGRQHC
jgi:hypothetical protein